MAMKLELKLASGRAHCKVCDEVIEGDDIQVTATGFRSSGAAHLKCLISNATVPDKEKDLLLDAVNHVKFNLRKLGKSDSKCSII